MKKRRKLEEKIKRCVDVIFAAGCLIIGLPLWAIIALLVKLGSSGPVFFVQARPGYHRKIFNVYKYRTMRPGSEQMIKGVEVLKGDNRVTALGRFLRRTKLDEIPQLLNVLKGDMSLVGPRPERIASLEEYTKEIEKRLNMKPGLTGLAQVSGNIYLNLEERYRLDVFYVEHFSIGLDIKILWRTVGVILLGEEHYKGKPLISE